MNVRKIFIITIIAVCVFAIVYGMYLLIAGTNSKSLNNRLNDNNNIQSEIANFDELFDNNINYQNFTFRSEYKMDTSKELVYTVYTQNQEYEGKYNINVKLPYININNLKINDINKEIILTFAQKVQSIMANADKENAKNTIYTVEYTAFLNENILSLVIRATLKEGNNAQRVIVKAYTYNLSSNEEISLKTMLEIKGLDQVAVSSKIREVIQESVEKNTNLAALGYNVFQRDINSDIYQLENSNNYLLGPNETIYIIYAYGNTRYTSEKDIVVIE